MAYGESENEMKNEQFKGIFPYLVTPLDEKGHLKEEVLADLVDHLISKGVHGLTPLEVQGRACTWTGRRKSRQWR